MGALLGMVVPAPYRWAAIALLVVAWSGFWWLKGCQHTRDQWDAATARQEAANLEEVQRLARVSERVVTQYVTRTKVIHEQIAALPPVVTHEDDVACLLPAGFVGMWNDTNAASAPLRAGVADGPASAPVESAPQPRHWWQGPAVGR